MNLSLLASSASTSEDHFASFDVPLWAWGALVAVIATMLLFDLLVFLIHNRDRVVTRTMLLERVWSFHFDPQTNIVETHMSRLRAKLNEGDAADLIETVRGVGYRMRGNG